MSRCDRCLNRASTSVARATGDTRVNEACGRFRVDRKISHVTTFESLCGDHARALRSSGLFRLTEID